MSGYNDDNLGSAESSSNCYDGNFNYNQINATGSESISSQVEGIVLLPRPSKPITIVQGKTIGVWSIERRQACKALSASWAEILKHKNTPAMCVHLEKYITDAHKTTSMFSGVPNEDFFVTAINIIDNALTGDNFLSIEKNDQWHLIEDALGILQRSNNMSAEVIDVLIKMFYDHEIYPGAI